jgi:gas vesicle protein
VKNDRRAEEWRIIMKEELTNRKGSTLTTVLAGGALVGAGLGLLLAPKSGRELRKDLKRAADRVSQTVDIGKDLYGEGRVFMKKAVDASKKAYSEEKPLEPIIRSNGMGSSLLAPILTSGIIGAGIGAGIALLLAPKSGRETREDVKRFALSTRGKVVSAIDKGKHLYAAGKGAITGAVEGKIPYVEGQQDVMHAV